MKYLAAVLLSVVLLLQYRLWLGNGGMREVQRLRSEIQQQRAANDLLRERNRTLSAEVIDLKKGTTAIEERARTDLGMVGDKETFFQVITPRGTPKTGQSKLQPKVPAAADGAKDKPAG
jgi:cell division protein FtsB